MGNFTPNEHSISSHFTGVYFLMKSADRGLHYFHKTFVLSIIE